MLQRLLAEPSGKMHKTGGSEQEEQGSSLEKVLASTLKSESEVQSQGQVCVVWAGGYHSSLPPIEDEEGRRLEVKQHRGQVLVDLETSCFQYRLVGEGERETDNETGNKKHSGESEGTNGSYPSINKDESSSDNLGGNARQGVAKGGDVWCPLPRLYGSGLGFGLPATNVDGKSDGRADAVALYTRHQAAVILAQILGPDQAYGEGAGSWGERKELMRLRSRTQTEKRKGLYSKALPQEVARAKDDLDVDLPSAGNATSATAAETVTTTATAITTTASSGTSARQTIRQAGQRGRKSKSLGPSVSPSASSSSASASASSSAARKPRLCRLPLSPTSSLATTIPVIGEPRPGANQTESRAAEAAAAGAAPGDGKADQAVSASAAEYGSMESRVSELTAEASKEEEQTRGPAAASAVTILKGTRI